MISCTSKDKALEACGTEAWRSIIKGQKQICSPKMSLKYRPHPIQAISMLACQSRGFRLTGQRHCDKLHNAVPGGNASQPLSQSDQAIQDAGRESLSKEEYVKRQRRLWYLAIKPPMYSVCIIPVLIGAATAYCDFGIMALGRTGCLLLGSIFIIAWLNLSNDAFDAAMGVDGDKAESVVNLTKNRDGVLLVANLFLAAGSFTLWQVIKNLNDARIGSMLAIAVAMGYMYQGPPFRLSFKGLGEPITFVTFGPLAVGAFYLAHANGCQTSQILVSSSATVSAVLVGLTTATILFCSHFHQMEGDKAAGKKSPIVRLGSTQRGLKVLQGIVVLTYVAAFAAVISRLLPWTCAVLIPLSIPLAHDMLQFCKRNHKIPARIRPLKLYAVKWHTAMGLAICAAVILFPRMSRI